MLKFYFFTIISFIGIKLCAQTTLFEENFNTCTLPAGWQVSSVGNQNPTWFVGLPVNNDCDSISIDGTCMLIIDDDLEGNNTPAYTLDFISPEFSIAGFSTINLRFDAHYRDWGQGQEYFEILATDGVSTKTIAHFDENNQTGVQFHDYVTIQTDLAFLFDGASALRLIIRYDDGGSFDWWAGVDNISVVGEASGDNVILENFNDCTMPAGWSSEIRTGDFDWVIGNPTGPKWSTGKSIDGTCLVYFDDDILSDSAEYSIARMYTPWFDGTEYAQYKLQFDFMHRAYQQQEVSVYVQHASGEEFLLESWLTDVGGPFFNNIGKPELDLSPYRSTQMRVVFQFDDGKTWGWWAGFDNVKISGSGMANDLCQNAQPLFTGDPCAAASNQTAFFDGPAADCTEKAEAALWYSWQADFTGIASFKANATFNEIINVYTGSCGSLTPVLCENRDEHGFTGDNARFSVVSGANYLIRVSGAGRGFGISKGDICVEISQINSVPVPPANDLCQNAVVLAMDGPCVPGNNKNANMESILPTLDARARADVWYRMVATNAQAVISTDADFSEVITAYSGSCAALQEIACNPLGRKLELSDLAVGQTYFIAIASVFATTEGDFCIKGAVKTENPPVNDDCFAASPVAIGGNCVAGNNTDAGFSGYIPACVPTASRDIWFSFVAPSSGSVRIQDNADFSHVLGIWTGDCANLEFVQCYENPLRCDGSVKLGNLIAGQEYFIQIASYSVYPGIKNTGNVCVSIEDALVTDNFQPLAIQIDEECVGIGLAQLTVNVAGGIAPYTFLGNNSGEVLTSGSNYLFIVTDAEGCEKSLTGIVQNCQDSVTCQVSLSFEAVQPTCVTGGSLTAVPANALAPYTFNWSNSATTQTIENVQPGIYTVTVLDANGCSDTQSQVLTAPPLPTGQVTVTDATQGNSNGSILLDIIGGTGPFQTIWIDQLGAVYSMEDLFNIPAGSYTLTITDVNGCTYSEVVVVNETVGTQSANALVSQAQIIPNPAKNAAVLHLRLPSEMPVQLVLADASGKTLREWAVGKIFEKQIDLPLGDLPSGTYRLKIVTPSETLVRNLTIIQ